MEGQLNLNRNKYRRREFCRQYGLTAIFLLPYLILFIFFSVIPLAMGIGISFMNYNPYDSSTNAFVGFDNYVAIFTQGTAMNKLFWPAFWETMLFDIVAVPCLTIVPLLLATLINKQPPGYKLFRAILYLPSVVSITIVGIIFGSMFSSDALGLVNSLLGTEIDFLGTEWSRWLIILFVSIWWQTGTNFVIFSAALRDVPKSLYEACEMDGGGKLTKFFKVTLPNIKGSLGLCIFTTIIGYMGLYGQPVTLYGNGNAPRITDPQTPMIMIKMFLSESAYASRTGMISALAVVFGIMIMIVSTLQRVVMREKKGGDRYARKFETYTSLIEEREAK